MTGTRHVRPRESRSPNASRDVPRHPPAEWSLRIRSIVKQRPTFHPRCKSPHLAASRRWGDRFAPSGERHRLRRLLLPPATCGFVELLALAELRAFRLDPETVRRHTTGVEAPDRARARPADTGRAQISKWEVDGRFHNESLFDIYVVHDGAFGAWRLEAH